MNIAALQTMVGMNGKKTTHSQSNQMSGQSFGAVLGRTAVNNTQVDLSDKKPSENVIADEGITALLDATSIEELEVIIKDLGSEAEEVNLSLDSITNLGDFNQFAKRLDLDPGQVMESLSQLLDNVEIINLADMWTMLGEIDKIAPTFYKSLTDALEGNGVIAKQQAAGLLTVLKAMELVAPKTDLLLQHEQQVFALQSHLAMVGEEFETNRLAKNQRNPHLFNLMEMLPTRATIQLDTIHKVMDDSLTKNNAELLQQGLSSTVGTIAVAKGEFSLTELESQNQNRNEALIREMQNIFKRSLFGQTGGTNRLLIKLYPEHLGQVRIELLQTNGVMTARILASTALGKEMLDSQLHQLRQAFVQQNIQVERIDISQTLQDPTRNNREQSFNNHFGRQQQEAEQQLKDNNEEDKSFQEYLIELEV